MGGSGNPRGRIVATAMAWWKATGGRVNDPGGGLHHLPQRSHPIASLEYALAYACAALDAEARKKKP